MVHDCSDERGYFQNKKLQKKDDDKDDADENEDLNDSNFDEVRVCMCVYSCKIVK